ncbi:MAG: alpha/beta hydrolase [Aeromicrobium erythreum]
MTDWDPDPLGEGYAQHTIDLGDDPDGEGRIVATLVRRTPPTQVRHAILYVHGFSDYFFQTELADFFTERGFAFYALDLRKCGRSQRPGQTPHYVSDLALYDKELNQALALVRHETDGASVVLAAHSTGGLVLPLWLDRTRAAAGGEASSVAGLLLNSPWFDLQGKAWMRSVGTQAIRVLAKVKPFDVLKLPVTDAYGTSLHSSAHGTWDYDVAIKPLQGYDVTLGWLNAVRRGHARLHRGLDVGVPSLVLRSDKTHFARSWNEKVDRADVVLDVRQIARWSGCLGGEVSVVPIEDARHDVFLSLDEPRKAAYEAVDAWLDRSGLL